MRSARAVPDAVAWRADARALLAAAVPPSDVVWSAPGATGLLFDAPPPPPAPDTGDPARVPSRFVKLAEFAVLHREAGAHALLYRVLWRLTHGEPQLLDDAADPDVRALVVRVGQVRRDLHKMHAFVRFREIVTDDVPHFVAWYAPDHHILELAAPFFRERFSSMRWTILTPDRSVSWNLADLAWTAGVPRQAAPPPDELEAIWTTYYTSIFNPARANPRVMRQHMPARFWPQLPESAAISALLAAATPRVDGMLARGTHVPESRSLPVLRDASARCDACELCGPATQTVFGEGPDTARLVLVGEQPGDEEDRRGRPFLGPAGQVLDHALAAAGLDRAQLYVTNAVKHFRFLPRGKQRLHQRPTADQVRACKPWLAAELEALAPRVIVCLGATAVQSLVGSRFRITNGHGQVLRTRWSEHLIATHHPAALLRCDPEVRPRYETELIAALVHARTLLDGAL